MRPTEAAGLIVIAALAVLAIAVGVAIAFMATHYAGSPGL